MEKLLLIALTVSGLALVPVQRSNAQISGVRALSFGFPGGYYAYYPAYYNYYPYCIRDKSLRNRTCAGSFKLPPDILHHHSVDPV